MNPIYALARAQCSDPRLAQRKGEPGAPGRELGRIDGWWSDGFHREMIRREFSSVLGPQPSGEPAVLTHRPGEVSLDNAFALIEGHPNEIFESEFAAWLGHPPSGSRVSIGRVRLRAPLAPTSLTGNHMLPRITQQSHSAAPRRESQIEPWLALRHRQACAAPVTQGRCSAGVKTTREVRISAIKHDERGWMSENYCSSSRGRSVFS